jgi:hypothetical protein
MQRSKRDILFIFIGLFVYFGTLWASKSAVETRLGRDVAYLNTLGRRTDGEKSLTLSLRPQFRAGSARINEMRRAPTRLIAVSRSSFKSSTPGLQV